MTKRRKLHNYVVAAALAMIAGLIAAKETAAAETPKRGGELVVGLQQDVAGFDNFRVLSFAHFRQYILQAIYERMFEVDGDTHQIKPGQALSSVPSDDRRTWRVTLRKGIKFSNGEDLNADAYVTHFTRLLTGKNGRFAGRYRHLTGPDLIGVEKVDAYSVDFKFRIPNPGFKDMAAQPNMSWWITAPKYLMENQAKPEFNQMPVRAVRGEIRSIDREAVDFVRGKAVPAISAIVVPQNCGPSFIAILLLPNGSEIIRERKA